SADEKAVTAVWVAVTIGITASVIVILLSIVFASVLLRGLSRALPLFGASPVDRLLGLGATILLFRTTVSLLFSSALGIVFWVWRIIPDTLSRAIIPMVTNSQQLARPDFKFKMASLILDELSREVASISRGSFVRFPFAELLLGLAVWALCGQLLQIVPDQAEGPQRLRLAQLAGRMSRVTWLNTLLFALIGMALYFSTAAIVAVPTLKEFNDPSTPTTQALQSRLKDMESPTAKAEFDAEFPENYGADDTSLSALKTYLDQREAGRVQTVEVRNPGHRAVPRRHPVEVEVTAENGFGAEPQDNSRRAGELRVRERRRQRQEGAGRVFPGTPGLVRREMGGNP